MSNDFNPGDYELEQLSIFNYKGEEYDIKGNFATLDIYEDLYAATISAELAILDGVDFYKNLPILGQEKVKIAFRTNDEFNRIELELYVYHSSPQIQVSNTGSKFFNLSLVSKERLTDQSVHINRSIQGRQCTIVKSILQNELKSTRPMQLDECSSQSSYTPAMHRPFEAIMMLVARAKSKETVNPAYVFFESNRGFNFKTLEKMIEAKATPYNMSPKKAIGIDSKQKFYSVDSYTKVKQVSTMEKMNNGSINSTIAKFDPITRTTVYSKSSIFNKSDYTDSVKLGSNLTDSRIYTDDFEFKDGAGQFKFVLAGEKGDILQKRQLLLNMYTNTILYHLDTPGNSDLAVGDVIDLSVQEQIATDDEYSPELSGKFLITALRHRIVKDKYYMSMEIARDSFTEDPKIIADIRKLKNESVK